MDNWGEILHMDCMEFMRQMPSKCFNFTFTDIPYDGLNKVGGALRNYNKGAADVKTFDLEEFLSEICRLSVDAVMVFCGYDQCSTVYSYLDQYEGITRMMPWIKRNVQPLIRQKAFKSAIEIAIFHNFHKSTGRTDVFGGINKYPVLGIDMEEYMAKNTEANQSMKKGLELIKKNKSLDKGDKAEIIAKLQKGWDIYENKFTAQDVFPEEQHSDQDIEESPSEETIILTFPRSQDKHHPTPKEVNMCKTAILLANKNKDAIVFDPCCGGGAILRAAKDLGRNFVGCELNDTFYAKACDFVWESKAKRGKMPPETTPCEKDISERIDELRNKLKDYKLETPQENWKDLDPIKRKIKNDLRAMFGVAKMQLGMILDDFLKRENNMELLDNIENIKDLIKSVWFEYIENNWGIKIGIGDAGREIIGDGFGYYERQTINNEIKSLEDSLNEYLNDIKIFGALDKLLSDKKMNTGKILKEIIKLLLKFYKSTLESEEELEVEESEFEDTADDPYTTLAENAWNKCKDDIKSKFFDAIYTLDEMPDGETTGIYMPANMSNEIRQKIKEIKEIEDQYLRHEVDEEEFKYILRKGEPEKRERKKNKK